MVHISQATKNDVPKILELIHDLAVYEKEPEAVKTTEADLLRDGFGEKPLFEVFMARWNNEVAGFALFFQTWSTWEGRPTMYLEDLFVKPDFRGKGIGMGLFQKVAKEATERACKRFEWAVLDWNEPARDFYHSFGAFHKKDWLPYRLEGEALKKLAETT